MQSDLVLHSLCVEKVYILVVSCGPDMQVELKLARQYTHVYQNTESNMIILGYKLISAFH